MTEPTDAEILELASQYWHSLDETERETEIELVRAALTKWGTPPAGVGEPYGYVYTVQVAPIVGDERKVERTVFTRNKPPCCAITLYTTPQPTQAQAGAVPLTDNELVRRSRVGAIQTDENGKVVMWSAYYRTQMEDRFKRGWREAEKHHGIKGGQHGAE